MRTLRRWLEVLLVLLLCGGGASARAEHAMAQFGLPKYARDFDHFDYVNPQATRGGSLNLSMGMSCGSRSGARARDRVRRLHGSGRHVRGRGRTWRIEQAEGKFMKGSAI